MGAGPRRTNRRTFAHRREDHAGGDGGHDDAASAWWLATPQDAATALADFQLDFTRQYIIVEVSARLVAQAAALARPTPCEVMTPCSSRRPLKSTKSAPRCSASPSSAAGHKARSFAARRARPGTARPRAESPGVSRSVIAVTRNECGDSRAGNPASFSRRLTSSQIRFEVMAVPDSFRVRPLPIRNNGDSLASPAMPAAST